MPHLGEWIRTLRIRFGYTQEELSEGICTVSTLSKIENGKSLGSKRVVDALMERILGEKVNCICYETSHDFEIRQMTNEILRSLEQFDFVQAQEQLKKLDQEISEETPLLQQFSMFVRTICTQHIAHRDRIRLLKEALMITMPCYHQYQYLQKKRVLLSHVEILILNHIAICHFLLEEKMAAMKLTEELYEYMQAMQAKTTVFSPVLPWIIYNRALLLESMGLEQEADAICRKGIELAVSESRILILPHLLCLSGRCKRGQNDEKTACTLFAQADAILELIGSYSGYRNFHEFREARMPILIAT
ncbi:MAG: helix-turn-helix domain-containing protein [Lachnospiraceae bacterium]